MVWNSQGLQIKADNASLSQILDQIASQTGAKIEGLSKDERVFGDYGPGQAREVLAQLLHGSGYDYLMLGDEGQGAPRTLILSARQKAGPQNQNSAAPPPDQSDDDVAPEPDEQPDQPEPPQVFQPNQPPQAQPQQPINPQGPMTPQQRMQLMQQQRLQQMQEMQRQYQQQQQQPQ